MEPTLYAFPRSLLEERTQIQIPKCVMIGYQKFNETYRPSNTWTTHVNNYLKHCPHLDDGIRWSGIEVSYFNIKCKKFPNYNVQSPATVRYPEAAETSPQLHTLLLFEPPCCSSFSYACLPRSNINSTPCDVTNKLCCFFFSMFHRAFFNSIIDKHQQIHFFTFKTVLV